jgi:hypothetical protein
MQIVGHFEVLESGLCGVYVRPGDCDVYCAPLSSPADVRGFPMGLRSAPIGALIGWRQFCGTIDADLFSPKLFRPVISAAKARRLAKKGAGV